MLKYPNLKDHIFDYPLLSEHECDQVVSTLDEADDWDTFVWYNSDHEHVDVDKQSQLKSTINHTVTDVIQPHINDELFNAFHSKYHDPDITTGESFWEN